MFVGIGVFFQMFLAGIWSAHAVSTPDAHVFFGLGLLLASLLALTIPHSNGPGASWSRLT